MSRPPCCEVEILIKIRSSLLTLSIRPSPSFDQTHSHINLTVLFALRMFSNTFIAVALAAFTTANPLLARTDAPQCSTGTINCCNSVQDVKSAKGSLIAALLSLDVAELTGAIGLGCTALVGGAQWFVLFS